MTSRIVEDGKTVVETTLDGVHRYRILTLDDDEPARPPTEAEKAMPRDPGGPPPFSWQLNSNWEPKKKTGPPAT